MGILGDTDGNEGYLKKYADYFSDVDLLCLHVGSFADRKYGSGSGHLHAPGTLGPFKRIMKKNWETSPLIVLNHLKKKI